MRRWMAVRDGRRDPLYQMAVRKGGRDPFTWDDEYDDDDPA